MSRTMTVTQLSSYLKGVFDDEELLHDVVLTGEVTDISYSDKHTFLLLADGRYSVRCVHFGARDNIEKGAKIALRGSVSFYDKKSSVSFNYNEFRLDGTGDKNARLEKIKRELQAKGYFENRKPLPKYVTDVVVVTSPDGAAIRDFMRVVYDKCPFVNIRVYGVRVQGEGAADMIRAAVQNLQSATVDAIVLCRGGGSDEDLDSFNDAALAQAVAESRIPIISAVGHEIDYTLCDYCAGTRAGTPSIAGEIVNSHALSIVADMYDAIASIKSAVERKYTACVNRLNRLGSATTNAVSRRIGASFAAVRRLADGSMYALKNRANAKVSKLAAATGRLRSGMSLKLNEARHTADVTKARFTALDPRRIIKIGYAAVMGKYKRIMSAGELSKGQSVTLVFEDGVADCDVTDVRSNKRY